MSMGSAVLTSKREIEMSNTNTLSLVKLDGLLSVQIPGTKQYIPAQMSALPYVIANGMNVDEFKSIVASIRIRPDMTDDELEAVYSRRDAVPAV